MVSAYEPSLENLSRSPRVAKGAPLIGVLPRFVRDPAALLLETSRAHPGEIVKLPLGPTSAYFLSDPRHIQHVLHDNWRSYGKGAMWKAARRLMGNGLVASEGDSWLRGRKLVQPVFTPKHLAGIIGSLATFAAREGERISKLAGTEVDVAVEMTRTIQSMFMQTLFGAEVAREDTDRISEAVVKALEGINLRAFLHFVPGWMLPGERALVRNIAIIDEIILGLVEKRRREPTESNDLLGLLLRARDAETNDGMNDRQLRDELVSMFVAGNDTSAVAMTWIWHVLAEHPNVRAKICEELANVLGDRTPAFEDLGKLVYTRAVIQETMRMYPVGWMIPRVASESDVIDGVTIPKGAMVVMSQYATHRDPRFWSDPDAFKPERFLGDGQNQPRYAYFPFGGGPRQCIGHHLATAMMQLVIASVTPRVTMNHASKKPVEMQSTITLRPRGGLRMNVRAG